MHYVYRSWFRPYQTEIDYREFLVKLVAPKTIPPVDTTSLSSIAELTKKLNAAICSGVKRLQDLSQQLDGHSFDEQRAKLERHNDIGNFIRRDIQQCITDQKFHILQPLFRAIAIVVSDLRFDVDQISIEQLPVVITRTGVEDGLSAPITFDSIPNKIEELVEGSGEIRAVKTTLQKAITFLMDLERREINAFGRRPDPMASPKDLDSRLLMSSRTVTEAAEELGWTEDMGSLEGPSSQWVDQKIYPSELGWTPELMNWLEFFGATRRRMAARFRTEQQE